MPMKKLLSEPWMWFEPRRRNFNPQGSWSAGLELAGLKKFDYQSH